MYKFVEKLPHSRLRRLLYPKLDFHFKSIDETLEYCSEFFAEAEKIYIATAESLPPFYNNDMLLSSFEKAALNGAEIKILFGPAFCVDSIDFINFAMQYQNVELYRSKDLRRGYFKIIEDRMGFKLAIIDTSDQVGHAQRESWILTHDYLDEIVALENKFREEIKVAEYVGKKGLIDRLSIEKNNSENKLCYRYH